MNKSEKKHTESARDPAMAISSELVTVSEFNHNNEIVPTKHAVSN